MYLHPQQPREFMLENTAARAQTVTVWHNTRRTIVADAASLNVQRAKCTEMNWRQRAAIDFMQRSAELQPPRAINNRRAIAFHADEEPHVDDGHATGYDKRERECKTLRPTRIQN